MVASMVAHVAAEETVPLADGFSETICVKKFRSFSGAFLSKPMISMALSETSPAANPVTAGTPIFTAIFPKPPAV